MTKDQIEQMLGEMGIPFRYHHFTQKEMQDIPLPIVVWLTPGTDNFFADGKTYKKITKLDIELYTDDKDWELEKKLISEVKATKQQIEEVRHQMEDAERNYDLEKLAKLKYGTLPELEKKLEEVLDKYGIAWEQTASEWLESEKMWESLYEMEV